MKVLICGGRNYGDRERFATELAPDRIRPTCIIHGGASGADALADWWAKRRGLPVMEFPANWAYYGRRAGPLRNQWMLEYGKPDMVIAFPGGTGTADMVRRAKAAGIPVREVSP